jgi:hypothetical protein
MRTCSKCRSAVTSETRRFSWNRASALYSTSVCALANRPAIVIKATAANAREVTTVVMMLLPTVRARSHTDGDIMIEAGSDQASSQVWMC